jgi:hypothetical protein
MTSPIFFCAVFLSTTSYNADGTYHPMRILNPIIDVPNKTNSNSSTKLVEFLRVENYGSETDMLW